ncbi:hypothetical protein QT972_24415 [Microcoleus sp. herbarium7]|uniref:hypothetical protein n=1 Tax=Microcoleus sp. herbarium7 TaxID=3055435 RepID=UPI002FD1C522
MITLAHARKSDISFHLMGVNHMSRPHLIDVAYSSQDVKCAVVTSLVELTKANPGVSITEFDDCCKVKVTAAYELPIVAEIIADYWSSHGFVVARYSGAHDAPEEVETFLTPALKHRYAQGKYTYPYGTTNPDTGSESES